MPSIHLTLGRAAVGGEGSVPTSHEFPITVFAPKSFYKVLTHLMGNGVLHAFMHACAPGAYLMLAQTRRGCQVRGL